MKPTAWQDAEVARKFLEGRRAAIPYAADQTQMLLHLVRHFRPNPELILDLGCGDGFLARTLLNVYPEAKAILIDHSEPMLERARAAMSEYGDRVQIRRGDLAAPLATTGPFVGLDLVVSGYAIHHLPHERKRSLYGEIYVLLKPGGLFVNVEHVASASARAEALFDELYIDHIAAHTGEPREQVEADYHSRPDKKDNILELVFAQIKWLREIGFEHADCYFKWLELAVFAGVKE